MTRSRFLSVLTAVLAMVVAFLVAPPPAAAAVTFTSTGVNQNGGNCLDLPGSSSTDGTQLRSFTCGSGANQNLGFTPVPGSSDLYTITTQSGQCVDVSGASTADNAAIIQWPCHDGTNQQWRLTPVSVNGTDKTFNLVSVSSGKCVTPSGGSSASNTNLVQLPCATANGRVWRLPGFAGSGGDPATPPAKTVRVYWLKPSDVPFDQRYPDGIANVMREAQRYYKQELGKTFTLNNPVVEVVGGDQPRSWYENTPNGGDRYWWAVTNMQNELARKFGLDNPDSRWLNVGEISAEGEGAGGGASPGWVVLSGHDADGAAGTSGQSMNRWYGGMVHELGHAFGLPDAASTDGTPMSASFYDYPNTHFNQSQKNQILNGPYGSFLS
ncbi:hypothetical protein M2271_000872 [Streptomyces sp. LBL]|uniref:RICIN domain-containing protein n=1 Tax=Streptomyces sp. LBL TaxID=2940562 RepID=UPI002475CDEE|nr:RICIN domain-containing protein [Streptomyces sp. LBL]MDH6623085.1 hypothetical protein [Streptomyces sp. LBL]